MSAQFLWGLVLGVVVQVLVAGVAFLINCVRVAHGKRDESDRWLLNMYAVAVGVLAVMVVR